MSATPTGQISAESTSTPWTVQTEIHKTCWKKQVLYFLLDHMIAGLVVGPMTTFAWWGTWTLLNNHLFPNNQDISGLVCCAIGNTGLLLIWVSQNCWKRFVRLENNWHWVFGYHFYTCLCFFFNVCHWRGMWTILDFYTSTDATSVWITVAIGRIYIYKYCKKCTFKKWLR